ncbi:CinA family nicotinamide mononucleotide deamidase-related protein [Enterovibrio norvegicus]|uniref:CinA-like protein n=1 Tax=Enterovibrio norvegicus DSM 15893 TaxID=1121869 RepID=A0A1I5MPD8_9GAMM|nr:CinA family nicotinamide mononucleotide deamidase-related protein [Enterovibrio norvegicus]SFP11448.1 molybdenum cofactor synthesis domain-containing protein/competence/damage-inducible protein CinA N-terminal domain-containing protein [Enterovibrio norvegicus DSM 15893]
MGQSKLRVAMLSTGEEVLHGDITDTNAAWLSRRCFEEGFAMHRRVTVGDSLDELAIELVRCSQVSDIVIVNGGLGPTTDDLTTEAMAMAMNVDVELNAHWLSEMKARFEKNGKTMPKSNIKQAMLPEGAELIDNPVGSACGFVATLNDCLFFFTPGVPSEFKQMFDNEILPQLQTQFPNNLKLEIQRLYTFGLSESLLNDRLEPLELPDLFEIGYRSALPFIEVKLFSPRQHSDISLITDAIRKILADHMVGDGVPMLESVGGLLAQSGQTVAVAEKFTGGYLANWFNQSAMTKDALVQGWVLNENALNTDGDYNPLAAVLAMATASRENAGAHLGLACGNAANGEVALGLSTVEGDWGMIVKTRRSLTHEDFRCYASTMLMDMLRRYLQGKEVFGEISSLITLESLFIPVEDEPIDAQ